MLTTPSLYRAPASIPPFPVRQFTVAEYHQMAKAGVFVDGAPFELLEGWIVPKMTRNPRHDICIELVLEALRKRLAAGWRLRCQLAITTLDSEPEPDLAVVRGAIPRGATRHPGPPDIALVVEVADTSLAHDRDEKGRLYARASIPVYWIVNLVDARIEVFSKPSGPAEVPLFQQRTDYGLADVVPLVLDGQELALVPVADLIPA